MGSWWKLGKIKTKSRYTTLNNIVLCYNNINYYLLNVFVFQVSLLLGTIIRKIPLPVATSSVGEGTADVAMDHSISVSDAVLDVNQLEIIGNYFLEVLLKMKHNGAIDKTRAGFTALCNRLLCSDDSRFVARIFNIYKFSQSELIIITKPALEIL